MSFHAQFDRVQAFLLKLDGLDMDGQIDAFINEAIESGGSYLRPGTKGPCSHLLEISLYNIFAIGAFDDEAIRNWKKAACAQMQSAIDAAIRRRVDSSRPLLAARGSKEGREPHLLTRR